MHSVVAIVSYRAVQFRVDGLNGKMRDEAVLSLETVLNISIPRALSILAHNAREGVREHSIEK